MLRRVALVWAVFLGASSWCMGQGPLKAGSIPSRRALERLQLERQWMNVVPLGVGEQLVFFNVAGDQLFAQTSRGSLHAFDAESGRYQWGAKLETVNSNPLPVSANSNQVFVTALRTLHALDRATGRPIWKVETDGLASSATTCDEEYVTVGTRTGKLACYSVRDHSKDTPPGLSPGSFIWARQTGGPLTSRALVTQRLVSFASEDHRVYTVAQTQDMTVKAQLIYRFLTGGPIRASLSGVGKRTLIVASEDFNVYGIDLFTADQRWVLPTGAPVDQEPIVAGNDVIIINQRGRLFRVDGLTGSVAWEQETDGEKILAVSPSRIYLSNAHSDLEIVDRGTGRVIHSAKDTLEGAGLNNRDLGLEFPNYQNDRLYLGGPQGLIFCIREAGKLKPTPLRDPSLPPFGLVPPEGISPEGAPPANPANAAAPANDPGAEAAPAPDTGKNDAPEGDAEKA
jgi:outer membrane protein assembly factor BamB